MGVIVIGMVGDSLSGTGGKMAITSCVVLDDDLAADSWSVACLLS